MRKRHGRAKCAPVLKALYSLMTIFRVIGLTILVLVFGIVIFSETGFSKAFFAIFLFGLSLFALPKNYRLDFLKLVYWLGMSVLLFIFVKVDPVPGFVCILLYAGIAKLAGVEFDEESDDDWHLDLD